jgi:uncharacterized membrane protein YjjP (DUF1212 family)
MTVETEAPAADERDLFVLRLAQALHASGYAAHSLEEVLQHVCDRLGLIGQFFTTPTAISAAFGPLDRQRTFLIRVQPGELNLGRLASLDRVARQVVSGTITPVDGSRRIAEIWAKKPTYPGWLRVIGYGIVSAAGCQFLGGGAADVAVGMGVGLLIGVLALIFRRFTITSHVFELTGAFLASALVAELACRGAHISVPTTTLAGLISMLPGLTITVAMTELASRHLSSGTARMSAAFIVFTSMAFGVALGSAVISALHHGIPVPVYPPTHLPGWTRAAALLLAPIGFALLLRARPRDIPVVLCASLLGYAAFQAGAAYLGQTLGASIGALTIGLVSNAFERLEFGPASVPLVPGVLLLVPGSIGYRSLTLLLSQDFETGLSAGVSAVLIAFALAGGLIVANVLVPPTK